MSAKLLFGKDCADNIYKNIRSRLQGKKAVLHCLGLSDPQWRQYANSLKKSALKCGVETAFDFFEDDVPFEQMRDAVVRACADPNAAGVLIEQPLPARLCRLGEYVDTSLDIDCVNPLSVAALYRGKSVFSPATPAAVIRLLDFHEIPVEGKHVVIIGRGAVGRPLMLLMLARNATVTVCHTKTVDLPEICRSADVLVSACGVGGLVKENFVTDKTVAIDVGLSFSEGKTCGDIDPIAESKCRALSPVPGGVGPVTRAVLFENILKAFDLK